MAVCPPVFVSCYVDTHQKQNLVYTYTYSRYTRNHKSRFNVIVDELIKKYLQVHKVQGKCS